MTAAPAIRATDLTMAYANTVVLDLPSLTLQAKRIHIVVGGNGAGKTTLLRVLAGLEPPTSGAVEILGTDPYGASRPARRALQRRMTLCLQKPYLFSTTVRRNIEYGLRAWGVPSEGRAERVGASAEALGLSHLLDRSARTLSGGESQRVSLARALVLEPEVVLLDEPLANVDAASVSRVEATIRELREAGSTVVIATHQLDQAYRLSADVIRLEQGRMAPAALDNLLEGQLVRRGDAAFLVVKPGVEIRVMTDRRGFARAAVDPTAVLISTDAVGASALNELPARVTGLQERGDRVVVTADAGVPLQALIGRESLHRLGLTIGSEVVLTFEAISVTVF